MALIFSSASSLFSNSEAYFIASFSSFLLDKADPATEPLAEPKADPLADALAEPKAEPPTAPAASAPTLEVLGEAWI